MKRNGASEVLAKMALDLQYSPLGAKKIYDPKFLIKVKHLSSLNNISPDHGALQKPSIWEPLRFKFAASSTCTFFRK